MTTQAQHTTGPLSIKSGTNYFYLCNREGEYIAKTTGDSILDEANAAFIVRACNAHDEMLTACRARLNEWHKNVSNMEKKEPESVKLSRSAIVAATKD